MASRSRRILYAWSALSSDSWIFWTLRLQLAALSRAVSENRLDERLKIYTVPRLLIVDEICYLPIDRTSPRRLSPTNKYESGALSALFAIGQWRVSSRLYCRQTSGWGERGGHDTIVRGRGVRGRAR